MKLSDVLFNEEPKQQIAPAYLHRAAAQARAEKRASILWPLVIAWVVIAIIVGGIGIANKRDRDQRVSSEAFK